ncbi:hypothetical protein HF521_001185 [Silurus meridionalis]|uniref:Uncharacterized protein n=1 Tax=Silurus meridionalis TaxID=175797 RepID=A0A8T0B5L7_SILME|nr:hypothetical protein HF521_001185 [Silurus meridionalis]
MPTAQRRSRRASLPAPTGSAQGDRSSAAVAPSSLSLAAVLLFLCESRGGTSATDDNESRLGAAPHPKSTYNENVDVKQYIGAFTRSQRTHARTHRRAFGMVERRESRERGFEARREKSGERNPSSAEQSALCKLQQNSDGTGWDSDQSSIVLLVHMLPSTSKGHKKSAKMISYQAFDHVVRHLRIGTSVETFYAEGNVWTNQHRVSTVDLSVQPMGSEESVAAPLYLLMAASYSVHRPQPVYCRFH